MHLPRKVTTKDSKNKLKKKQIQLQIKFEEAIKGYNLFLE